MTVFVRAETPDDIEAIYRLNTAAFDGRTEEADLVDALRSSGDLLLSLVAVRDAEPVGHIAFSRLIVDAADGPVGGVALAPVSVHPGCQSEGVGSVLIRAGLEKLAARSEQVVLVVGNPTYYSRFGFSTAAGKRYPSSHSGPHFMALVIGDPAGAPIGPVRYPEAFELVN
ncbi:MAG: N-acetyltransferase [Acidimicrobiia bacterium]|nr:N-acetyltransferase [Acidimicrobiia bacterium]